MRLAVCHSGAVFTKWQIHDGGASSSEGARGIQSDPLFKGGRLSLIEAPDDCLLCLPCFNAPVKNKMRQEVDCSSRPPVTGRRGMGVRYPLVSDQRFPDPTLFTLAIIIVLGENLLSIGSQDHRGDRNYQAKFDPGTQSC
ncbi:unnamed protein product [Pleuronectes platessa]|uniref:Uncharacterized protein n=1 Tax=Pleuronectes platessa TaxID=8262 RepID=A0A9N7TK16_PLEPL|nr:unnamed protein product [Pleuronectes platessa]